jgi:hypothetical protein
MKAVKNIWRKLNRSRSDENGSALVIVTLLLALLTIYVSASLTTSTTDVIASNFEVAQKRGFYTAYSKMEQMTRDFSALFLTAIAPGYDRMCKVVIDDPSLMNNFRIVKPNVTCNNSTGCTPSYTGRFKTGTDIYDLGWVGDPRPFCIVDVCNPKDEPQCGFLPRPPVPIQVEKGDFAGLQGFARRYRMVATAVSENRGGADVQITRDFDNILLPLFQFGIFADTDFELYIPPNWAFGGWVHTNGDFFLTGGDVVQSGPTLPGAKKTPRSTFSQYIYDRNNNLVPTAARITIAKHLVIGNKKDGASFADSYMMVYQDSNPNNAEKVDVGSAKTGPLVSNCNGIIDPTPDTQPGTCDKFRGTSAGTVRIGVRKLQLPIQNVLKASPIELIKRGLATDNDPNNFSPYISARYYYKPGIRITLADYQNQLPRTVLANDNAAAGTGDYGGIQLDGPDSWLGENVGGGRPLEKTGSPTNPDWYYQQEDPSKPGSNRPIPRGYQPKIVDTINGRPTGARVNGYRVHGWIKVELVKIDGTGLDPTDIRTFDITEEFLNLGVTVPYQSNPGLGSFYYPRVPAQFPPTTGINPNGPFPDENSIIHLQRFGAPYTNAVLTGLTPLPATPVDPVIDDVGSTGPTGVNFDYYSSMAMRNNNNNSLTMFGIRDDKDTRPNAADGTDYPDFTTRYDGTANKYGEPQPDPGGYYTDIARALIPLINPQETRIDFRGSRSASRPTGNLFLGQPGLSENVNLPKGRSAGIVTTGPNAVLNQEGETTWRIGGLSLVPFPINVYDAREGLPQEDNDASKPVPGLVAMAPTKNGSINLVEIDMGNLGRLLKGDFDQIFAQMGQTRFRAQFGRSLSTNDIRDNIILNQDNGFLVYVSDRRGDEPVVAGNPNLKPDPTRTGTPIVNTSSVIGDGEYNREDVIWNPGGSATTGIPSSVAAKVDTATVKFGCEPGTLKSDNQDKGKSPQDANNDCFIQTETKTGMYSETTPYTAIFNADQFNPTLIYSDFGGATSRLGAMVAMTQVPTTLKQPWSRKPPVTFQAVSQQRVEIFRRGVRLVNASNLFPTGPLRNLQCTSPDEIVNLGITITTENPLYVFGNYNAPAAEVGDTTDLYPGISVVPDITAPTSPAKFNGGGNCGINCSVPAAIIADAVTFLSGACVGTTIPQWNENGATGWLDSRSFVMPYQAIGYRSARNTVYRFALITGFTPSWYSTFWGNVNAHQGFDSKYSSGGINNFPRFLEDWRFNGKSGSNAAYATYAGSLIRLFKSRQANGVFKRISSNDTVPAVDHVYVPPNRDWIFDVNFTTPCTLPPGSPFLQLIDLKGFQQSSVQQR